MLRKRAALIFLVALVLFIFGAMLLWTATVKNEPPFLKNAHGYGQVVAATKLLTNDPYPDPRVNPGGNPPDLAGFVSGNRAALNRLREALRLRIEAPAETYDTKTLPTVFGAAAQITRLAQTMKYEGRLAESEGRHSDAADIYLEVMRFGQKMQAGPMLFLLNGLSIEGLGHQSLKLLESNLKGPDRARVTAELEKLNASRIEFDEIIRRERYFARRNTPTPLHYFFAVYKQRGTIRDVRRKCDNFSKSVQELADKYKAQPSS